MKGGRRYRGVALVALGVVVGAGATVWLTTMGGNESGQEPDGERRILYWRAPMDPTYTSDRPGKSPMGMDLVPVYADEMDAAADPGGGADTGIRVSQAFLQNFAVRTALARRGALPVAIRTVGILAHNEERVVSVQTKYEGWIERASVNNVGETVARGEALFEIYSPQLVTTQREFLGAMQYVGRLQAGGAYPEAIDRARSLLEASRERLLYWDMTGEQIDALAESQVVNRTVQVFAPASGFIVEKMSDSMEGLRIGPGMTVLKIADHSTLWAETEFYEGDLRHVREGQAVVIEADAYPGLEWSGRILFFRPAVNPETRTLTAFVEVANPDLRLRPMMYVNVMVRTSGPADAVMVPTEAVLHSGTRTVVIVARDGGLFEPRQVVLGTESEGMQEVAAGLAEGESVVVSSQFLIDSDANLRAAISQLLGGADGVPGAERTVPGPAPAAADSAAAMAHPAMAVPDSPSTPDSATAMPHSR